MNYSKSQGEAAIKSYNGDAWRPHPHMHTGDDVAAAPCFKP